MSDDTERPRAFLAWAGEIFGPVALDRDERALRFLEEAIELAHALGTPIGTLSAIAERVYARPAGAIGREVGQAQVTLELLGEVIGHPTEVEAQREFDRVRSIPKEEWQARHAAKVKMGIAK